MHRRYESKLETSEPEVTIPEELAQKAEMLVNRGLFESVEQVTQVAVQEYLRKHWDPNYALES
jgi:Arc/MetJ-type ribon-helix-helix transcriptional regulator